MEVGTAIQIALTALTISAVIGAVSWARTVLNEVQQIRTEVLGAISGLRSEVVVRRVIRTVDEVPPELISENARGYIAETVETTGTTAAYAVKTTIELGVLYSELNRERNKRGGFDEDAPPSGKEEGAPPSGDPEPK